MKLALIGYGRMGHTIERLAVGRGHEIVARLDPAVREGTVAQLTQEAVDSADVCFEFTRPTAVVDNLLQLCEFGKRVVVGTTGWYDRLDEVAAAVGEGEAAVCYAANFSITVNLFFRLVERAAKLFGHLPDRDLFVFEAHHRAKIDAPSGTARRLAETILAHCQSKDGTVSQADGGVRDDELQVAAVRAGWIPGTHRVGIESPHDSIVLEHVARSREGFAEGAVRASEWLVGAPPGLYRFEDVLDDILAE